MRYNEIITEIDYKPERKISAARCITATVLQTKVDAECDKLATELS